MILEEGKGLQRITQTPGITRLFPQELEGPNSWPQPLCILGEEEGPFLLFLPLRDPRTHSSEMQYPCLPPAPGDSRGAEAGRLARGPQHS